jgi:acetolactate synthase I/II/III large subunit
MIDFDHFSREIAESSVPYAFGIPGGGASLDLIHSLESNGVEFITTFSEGSAAIMAGTVGRLCNTAGVAISIKGPGIANMMPGLALCRFEDLPIVAFAESYGSSAPKSRAHKRLDQKILTQPVVKHSFVVDDQDNLVRRAREIAKSEIPGPVLVELIEETEKNQESETILKKGNYCDATEVRDLIRGSQRPVLIVGAIATRLDEDLHLSSLNIPMFTTVAAKGIVDEASEYSAGVFTGVGLSKTPELQILESADLIVCLGLRNHEVLSAHPFSAKAINFDLNSNASSGFEFFRESSVDNGYEILVELQGFDWGRKLVRVQRAELVSHLSRHEFSPFLVFSHLMCWCSSNTRLVVDTGNFCTIAEHCWLSRGRDSFLGSSNSRYMGTSVPMGIAASLSDPGIVTIIVVGDGGIGMHLAELRIAIERKLPILLVLMSDEGFGSVRAAAIKRSLSQQSLIKKTSSWISVMEGLGMDCLSVSTETELSHALNLCDVTRGPCYIECIFDPEEYQTMTRNIRD